VLTFPRLAVIDALTFPRPAAIEALTFSASRGLGLRTRKQWRQTDDGPQLSLRAIVWVLLG